MLNLIVNGAQVSYDSLDEVKDAARESGLGLAFWRETLSECAGAAAMWNEFLNDLWQSGAEDEVERLDRTFPKNAPRQWLLVALTLGGDDPWQAFLAEWEAQGDERILPAVSSPAFVTWLKQVQTEKYDLLVRVLGENAAKWPNDLLLKALKLDGVEAETVERRVVVEKRKEPKPGDEMTIELPGGEKMVFCWCPEGSFMMGSPTAEEGRYELDERYTDGRYSDEAQHSVTLTKGFWMGKYEVTQAQWKSVMGTNPSNFIGANRPVERVSWEDCDDFIKKVNASGGAQVSLPTEAQWEYACRAGTTTPFNFGSTLNGDKANCDGNLPYGTMTNGRYLRETTPVGSYAPNAWGLYDMHGNVWEWCQDWYGSVYSTSSVIDPTGPASGSHRVLRGGGWDDHANCCRSAFRNYSYYHPSYEYRRSGFRLCCSVEPHR